MSKIVYIYTLSDPKNGQVRYVGKTEYVDKRLHQHIRDCNKSNNHKNCWIKSVLKNGEKPIFNILDEVEKSNWQYWEIYWIAQFKYWGFNLVNSTDGGEGNNNQIFTEKTRKKLSERFFGEKNPFFNKKHSEETKKILKHKRQFQKTNFEKLLECNKKRRKPVLQYDKLGILIKEWDSILEAEKFFNTRATISPCCLGKTKTSCGFIWKFKN